MPDPLYCPFCGHTLTHYGTGRSEFEYNCDNCNAAIQPDEATGTAKARQWDRQLARGVHSEFPLAKLKEPPPAPEEQA